MKAYAAKIPRKFLEESNNVWQPERATQWSWTYSCWPTGNLDPQTSTGSTWSFGKIENGKQ
jgi:hypothetical protein